MKTVKTLKSEKERKDPVGRLGTGTFGRHKRVGGTELPGTPYKVR